MYENFEREKLILDSAVCYKWGESETNSCILFVHGLGGDAEGTWKNLPNLIMGTAYARHCDLIAYSYKTRVFMFGSPDIDSLTNDFITFCETLIERYERVYFISHSLGSVLAINSIPKLIKINQHWINKLRGHILLAPAIWGSTFGWFSLSSTARELVQGSKTLKMVRDKWAKFSLNCPITSFVIFGSKDRVIKKNIHELRRLNIIPKSTSKNHVSISKINSINEVTYRTIMNCLYELDDSDHHDSRNYIKRMVLDSLKSDWEYDDHLSEFTYVPNFKIKIVEFTQRGEGRSFVESWVEKFSDPNGMMHNYAIYYINQRIYDFSMIFCDGYRYLIPLPDSVKNLVITKEQYALGKIMEKAGMYNNLDKGLSLAGIRVKKI